MHVPRFPRGWPVLLLIAGIAVASCTPAESVHVLSAPPSSDEGTVAATLGATLSHHEAAGPLEDPDVESGLPFEPEPQAEPNGAVPGLPRDPHTGFPTYPLPEGDAPPLTPGSFGAAFGAPLPRSPVWNPPGAKRVGIQAGHWMTNNVPSELRRLSAGSSAGGYQEWEVNLLLARRAAAILESAGVQVDVLPTTIPERYRAHAFVSIHADGDTSGRLNGYKIARPGFSSVPETDDDLVRTLYREYGAATGMVRDSDDHISRRMTFYYAFNTRRYAHAIDVGTPAAIIETGFLTNSNDRAFLTEQPDQVARGIANGILRFLELERGRSEWGQMLSPMP